MSSNTMQLTLNSQTRSQVTEEEIADLTQQLRCELLEIDVGVDFASNSLPAHSRAGEALTLGALVVTFLASGGVLTTSISTIKDWLTRNEKHSISLEIDGDKISITGASTQQEERLIDEWIKRHKNRK